MHYEEDVTISMTRKQIGKYITEWYTIFTDFKGEFNGAPVITLYEYIKLRANIHDKN